MEKKPLNKEALQEIIRCGEQVERRRNTMFGFDRITSDPNILGGKACIRGMRISVSLIVNLVANGMTFEEIIGELEAGALVSVNERGIRARSLPIKGKGR
jgi:hypothetical protein